MSRKVDLTRFNCSLAQALSAIGEWWTLLILRDAMIGSNRFNQFERSLGLSRNILSARLQQLVETGLMERTGPDKRPIYVLTMKGQELAPALIALMQWGDRWMTDGKPPIIPADLEGAALEPVELRNLDGARVRPEDICFVSGPGARPATIAFIQTAARGPVRSKPD